MAISEREHHIKVLEKMFYGMEKLENGVILPTSEVKTALAYAISSLKTDEAYQIMYEGGEIFTKADMVVMLTELKSEMNPIKECEQQIYGKDSWGFVGKCQDVIQEKIDKLKGADNGQKS